MLREEMIGFLLQQALAGKDIGFGITGTESSSESSL